jgi:Circularly permutated YpsA SLOG family
MPRTCWSSADRAAFDWTIELGISHGGWCHKKGRLAEDYLLGRRYNRQETPSADYPQWTEWNVRDSDRFFVIGWQSFLQSPSAGVPPWRLDSGTFSSVAAKLPRPDLLFEKLPAVLFKHMTSRSDSVTELVLARFARISVNHSSRCRFPLGAINAFP